MVAHPPPPSLLGLPPPTPLGPPPNPREVAPPNAPPLLVGGSAPKPPWAPPQTPVSSPDERLVARVGATMAHLMEEVRAVLEDQRPGAAYWVDHYVVPTADVDRWNRFYTNVLGAVA